MRRVLILLSVMIITFTACGPAPDYTFKGGTISPTQTAGEIAVLDQHGRIFRMSEQGGKVVMIFFGFTHCPDVCPTTLSDFKAIKQQLGEDAERVRFVMVSVDPKRDTPQRLSEYVGNFDQEFVALSPSDEQLRDIAKKYQIQWELENPDANGNYNVAHTALTYVVDRSGQLRLAYPFGFSAKDMAEDVKYLLQYR